MLERAVILLEGIAVSCKPKIRGEKIQNVINSVKTEVVICKTQGKFFCFFGLMKNCTTRKQGTPQRSS